MNYNIKKYMTKRIEWIDCAKGIGIVGVVWGHTGVIGASQIASFHMAFILANILMLILFIISGCESRKNKFNIYNNAMIFSSVTIRTTSTLLVNKFTIKRFKKNILN